MRDLAKDLEVIEASMQGAPTNAQEGIALAYKVAPEAIRRALAAEAEVERLRKQVAFLTARVREYIDSQIANLEQNLRAQYCQDLMDARKEMLEEKSWGGPID